MAKRDNPTPKQKKEKKELTDNQLAAGFGGKVLKDLAVVAKELKEQNKQQNQKLRDIEDEKWFEDMRKAGIEVGSSLERFAQTQKNLDSGNLSEKEIDLNEKILQNIKDNLEGQLKLKEEADAAASNTPLLKSLEEQKKALEAQNDALMQQADVEDFNQYFKKLSDDGLFTRKEISEQRRQFEGLKGTLEDPNLSDEERSIAKDTLDALKRTIESEESKREKKKEFEDSQSILTKISDAAENTARGIENFTDNLLAGGGLLATFGALALLFTDPQKLMDGIKFALDKVFIVIDSITKMLNGDVEGGFQIMKDNLGTFGVIAAFIGLKLLGPLVGLVGKVSSGIKTMVDFFKNFGKNMAKVGGFLKGAARLVGRLFLPITAIFYAIKGLVAGFQAEGDIGTKILTGLREGIGGILDFLLGIPQWLISKVLGMLGLEDAAEAVGSFSWKSLFTGEFWAGIGAWLKDAFWSAIDAMGEALMSAGSAVSSFFGGIGDTINQFIKTILRAGLPDPTQPLFSFGGMAASLIPDSIYEYAGINPDTGEVITPNIESGSREDGSEMIEMSGQNRRPVTTGDVMAASVSGDTNVSSQNITYLNNQNSSRSGRYNTANQ